MFGDLKSAAGVKELNCFLADKSYIEGYIPSQADVTVFAALASAPGTEFAHALRWYNHIRSYSCDEKKSFASATGDHGVRGAAQAKKDDDDELDLFGSDSEEEEETEEEKKIKEERLAKYAAKKANKKTVIAKSSLLIDVKPWDDETDMKALEAEVRKIEAEGLLWGASKLVPVGYGIKKLQINAVIEDDKISTDWLEEKITEDEERVQSMDIAAFNKI